MIEKLEKAMEEKSSYKDIIIENQDKEIERLSKEIDMWNRKYNEQFDIINELEKCINELLWYDNESDEYKIGLRLLDKLKELKEGK